jgi:hypothetical protein
MIWQVPAGAPPAGPRANTALRSCTALALKPVVVTFPVAALIAVARPFAAASALAPHVGETDTPQTEIVPAGTPVNVMLAVAAALDAALALPSPS